MVVIGHEAVGVADPVVSFIDLQESIKEVPSVLVVFEYRFLFITSGGDMVYSSGVFNA